VPFLVRDWYCSSPLSLRTLLLFSFPGLGCCSHIGQHCLFACRHYTFLYHWGPLGSVGNLGNLRTPSGTIGHFFKYICKPLCTLYTFRYVVYFWTPLGTFGHLLGPLGTCVCLCTPIGAPPYLSFADKGDASPLPKVPSCLLLGSPYRHQAQSLRHAANTSARGTTGEV
jgi:hypothetical protein